MNSTCAKTVATDTVSTSHPLKGWELMKDFVKLDALGDALKESDFIKRAQKLTHLQRNVENGILDIKGASLGGFETSKVESLTMSAGVILGTVGAFAGTCVLVGGLPPMIPCVGALFFGGFFGATAGSLACIARRIVLTANDFISNVMGKPTNRALRHAEEEKMNQKVFTLHADIDTQMQKMSKSALTQSPGIKNLFNDIYNDYLLSHQKTMKEYQKDVNNLNDGFDRYNSKDREKKRELDLKSSMLSA